MRTPGTLLLVPTCLRVDDADAIRAAFEAALRVSMSIEYETEDHVARITINRPGR